MAMQRVTYLAGGLPGVILSAGMGLVFLYGGLRVLDGTLTMGTLGGFMMYQMRLMGPVQALMGLYASLATAKVSLRRVHEIADAPVEVREEAVPAEVGAAQAKAATTGPATTAEAGGAIAFDDVSFSFDRGAPTLEQSIVRDRAGRDGGHRGPERRRQVDRGRPAAAAARSGSGCRSARRSGSSNAAPRVRPRSDSTRGSGAVHLPHLATGQRALRAAGGERRGSRGGSPGGRPRRPPRRPSGGPGHGRRRARRGALGRRAAAGRHRPRVSRRSARAGARRGNGGARPGHGATASSAATRR